MSINIFEKERNFISSIHKNYEDKVAEVKKIAGIQECDFGEKNTIEIITNRMMKKAEKPDYHFLYWMYVIGIHIKRKYNGRWILLHYQAKNFDRLVPAVINSEQEIWEVGYFCFDQYYNKNRMRGISFSFFYKLRIDRSICKPTLKDINIPLENIVFLEQ